MGLLPLFDSVHRKVSFLKFANEKNFKRLPLQIIQTGLSSPFDFTMSQVLISKDTFRDTRETLWSTVICENKKIPRLWIKGNLLAALDPHILSFIIKIWFEDDDNDNLKPSWQGTITHVPSGKRKSVQTIQGIDEFIQAFIDNPMSSDTPVSHIP